ncbi:MAG TPA: class I adenylate-forming enzyme family protein, partial [Xanthobacteraceae bacterium]|nr:class I adenylate-forming enzyme family protein [Xanthobacteraceae bacterium]
MNPEAWIDIPFLSLSDLIRDHAKERGSHAAIIQGERKFDYVALDRYIDRIAATLQRDGLKPKDSIAICAYTSIEYLAVFLAALRAGVAVAPLAPSSTPETIATMISDSGAKLFFLDKGVAEEIKRVDRSIKTRRIALDDSDAGEPYSKWLAAEGAKPAHVDVDPQSAFNIIYSSGTTGTPKGIVQSHAMRWGQVQRASVIGYTPDAVTMVSTPLYSNTTLVSVFPTLSMGGTLVMMPKFDVEQFLRLSEKHRASHAMLVPVQYRRIMAHPEFEKFDLSSYKMKFSTSAPFAADVKADVVKRWPGGLREYYGLTEGGGTCMLAAELYPNKLHTVGQPLPGHDMRLIDENGEEVLPGEIGEVVGHSPIMMNGYHNNPEKSRETEWFDKTGKRFLRTGDVGRFDEDGFLTLMDRKKDMIISGGFNIYPSDIEALMTQHPAVLEAAVVGVPSLKWGETP